MLDKPSGKSLLDAVVVLLRDELMPKLEGTEAFKVRVAANALELIGREIETGKAVEQDERRRLVALLEREGSLDELNRELCERIRDRRMTVAMPGVSQHLWASVLDKVAIDQPRYATFQRIRSERETGDTS
jgi:hypothetical protein